MAKYRIIRNVEASLIDKLKDKLLEDSWEGINIEKSFSKSLKNVGNSIPTICIEAESNPTSRIELGNPKYRKDIIIDIRIFALNDGQRKDLTNWLIELLENKIEYYEYVITKGEVTEKLLTGNINIFGKINNRKELQNTENLEEEDRYRQRITCDAIISLTI